MSSHAIALVAHDHKKDAKCSAKETVMIPGAR